MRTDLFTFLWEKQLIFIVTLVLNNINIVIRLNIDFKKKDKLIPDEHQKLLEKIIK